MLDFNGDPARLSLFTECLRLTHGYQFNPAFASEISRIDPLPHQRIAVYEHMLRQEPLRFLLADDAGAGKTIMTGLYLREMLMRGRIRRVLVVPPAGLVGNWERELRTLFRLRFRIVSGPDIRSGSPFTGPEGDLVIVSLDTLRGVNAFAALADLGTAPYDLVVFDEAHKLSASRDGRRVRKTQRYKLAEALAGCYAAPRVSAASPSGSNPEAGRKPAEPDYSGLTWTARHLLLLTATPHMGKDSPYHHLWRLLDHEIFGSEEAFRRFPPEARARHFIRRTKEEMVDFGGRPIFRERHCDTFGYDLTPGLDGERALYDRTTAYLLGSYNRAMGNRQAVKLAMGVFQRRLASSTWALFRSFERRIGKVQGMIADLEAGRIDAAGILRNQTRLDRKHGSDFFDQHDSADDLRDDARRERNEDYEDAVLGAVVAVTVEELREEIDTLRDLSRRARRLIDSGHESKFERLREVLASPEHADEKWLVFSEHRDTVDYLVRRLEALGHAGRLATIHGGMAWPEREEQVERFRDPAGARFLIATDAAGEGINLQFCRLMVNYDIPWNPARLEQRMGRIHRYGQQHDVRIVNLVSTDTREGRVLKVLLERLDAVRQELSSDKVFDVIGRLFENRSLREHMRDALTDDGERRARDRIESVLTGDAVRGIGNARSSSTEWVAMWPAAWARCAAKSSANVTCTSCPRTFGGSSSWRPRCWGWKFAATWTAASRWCQRGPGRWTRCWRLWRPIRPPPASGCGSVGRKATGPASGSTPASRCSTPCVRGYRRCANGMGCEGPSSSTRGRKRRTCCIWAMWRWRRKEGGFLGARDARAPLGRAPPRRRREASRAVAGTCHASSGSAPHAARRGAAGGSRGHPAG